MFDIIDAVVISVFWDVKNLEVNPVPALLADVYYTMSVCHSKEKGSLHCCIPLLYQWFTSHLYKDIYMVKTKGNHGWAQKFRYLNEKSTLWYPKKIDDKGIIVNYGSFPIIHLIGSKGCINYIPILAMRKLGHPVWGKPKEGELEGFIWYNEDIVPQSLFGKITCAGKRFT